MAIDLDEVGAEATQTSAGQWQVHFGLYLPGITLDKGYRVQVRVIHERDQFVRSVEPQEPRWATLITGNAPTAPISARALGSTFCPDRTSGATTNTTSAIPTTSSTTRTRQGRWPAARRPGRAGRFASWCRLVVVLAGVRQWPGCD